MVQSLQNLGFYANPTKIEDICSRNFGDKHTQAPTLMELSEKITASQVERDTEDIIICPQKENVYITSQGVFLRQGETDYRFTSKAFEGLCSHMPNYSKSFFKGVFDAGKTSTDAYNLGQAFFRSLIPAEKKLFRLEQPSKFCSEPKVRTILSENYNLLEETDLLTIMMNLESNWDKPVLYCHYSDNLTNITLGLSSKHDVYNKVGHHFPAINFRDSQAGGRGVIAQAIMHTVLCGNGLMSANKVGRLKKTHRSSKEDILEDMMVHLPFISSEARMVQSLYESASKANILIDSYHRHHGAFSLLQSEKSRFMRIVGKKDLNKLLNHIVLPQPLIVSKENTLGYVVDYLTLKAQEFDIDTKSKLERAAMDILLKYNFIDNDYKILDITTTKHPYPSEFILKHEAQKEKEKELLTA